MKVICSKAVFYRGNDLADHVFHDVVGFEDLPEEIVEGSKHAEWSEEEARLEFCSTEKSLQDNNQSLCKYVYAESVYFYCVDRPEWSYGVIIGLNHDTFGQSGETSYYVSKYDDACCFTNTPERRASVIIDRLYGEAFRKAEEADKHPLHHTACKDLTGERFGMLTVIERGENDKSRHARWWCECDCGNKVLVSSTALLNGGQKSCGCNRPKTITHGESQTRLYKIYYGIRQRCYNPNQVRYKHYGGRGIKMCDDWLNNYLSFADWAKANGYADDLSIDRIDVNGDYTPENCRWIPLSEQSANRRVCKQ